MFSRPSSNGQLRSHRSLRQACGVGLELAFARAANEATGPVELLDRSRARDDVRLLVTGADGRIRHERFIDLPRFLTAGDVVVVNDSATFAAALPAELVGRELRLHISSQVPGTRRRFVELRRPHGLGSKPDTSAAAGDVVQLPAGATARLVAPRPRPESAPRFWEAELDLPAELQPYLAAHGEPIRYEYVSEAWPLDAYQTIFARVPGSSEMPSAGRPFSERLVERLRANRISIATLTLHAGVSSVESDEEPTPEPFRVPRQTARTVTEALRSGRRVIAVGTTVIRALESAVNRKGVVEAAEGVTGLVVAPEHRLRSVTGLLTGFHEPEASHIKLLQAVAGSDAVARSYAAAIEKDYLWHEFGDVHLLMTRRG
jgi:S-adenosylmethionine:tRNA ribosyltransferase-isomerase